MDSQEMRMRECLEILRGKSLVKEPITVSPWEGRPDIARYWTTSIVNFALRVFINGEEEFYTEAFDALFENARYYRTHRSVRDDRDSYYWQLGEQIRILRHYGRFGDRKPDLLRGDTEHEMLQMMAEYLQDNGRLDYFEYEESRTWKIHESENHHLQRANAYRMQAMVLLQYPEFRTGHCADGCSFDELLDASTRFLKLWLCERGRKSLLIECASSVYSMQCLKEVYHLYDLTDDARLRQLAGSLLDVYFATVAQEHFHGVRGGGQSRVYPWLYLSGMHWFNTGHYCALGVGTPNQPRENDYTPLDTEYRCPPLIRKLAQSSWERGTYEIFSRPAGLAAEDNAFPVYSVRTDFGGIVRYSYCTPRFNLGTLHFHRLPNECWGAISTQNRIQGAIFAADKDARILPVPAPDRRQKRDSVSMGTSYNNWFSAQKEGCLITMPMPEEYTAYGGVPMNIWVSAAGGLAEHLTEKGGWLFTECGGAYAAICVCGDYALDRNCLEKNSDLLRPLVSGTRILCADTGTPVVMELSDRESYPCFEAFMDAVLANEPPRLQDNTLRYCSLQGHRFDFGLGKDDAAGIDGRDPAAPIAESYKSPFLNGLWGEPIVTLQFAGQTLTWDFTV